MTLSVEMSRITRAFGDAHTIRSNQIGEMKISLSRQLKEGRASAQRASAALDESIERDLTAISKSVAAIRSGAFGLLKRYKAGRNASSKELRAKLEADRSGLAAMVKRFKNGLSNDRADAKRIFREHAVSPKAGVKQSSPAFTTASPAFTTASTASTTGSAASTTGSAPAEKVVKSTSAAGAPAAVTAPKK